MQVGAGRYRLRAKGYEIAVRVDREMGTVLVLYVYSIE